MTATWWFGNESHSSIEHWLETLKITGWKTREHDVTVGLVQPAVHKTADKCIQCMWRQGPLDGSYLSQFTETRWQDMVDVSRHRHVTVDVDTKISHRLDWMHAVWTDLDVAAWNVVATTGRCSPEVLSLERVQLQSVAARPLRHVIYTVWHDVLQWDGDASCGWHHPYTW